LDRLAFDVITLPPLRERRDDIIPMAEHFAVKMSGELGLELFSGFSAEARRQLLDHAWPGNVRELKNVVQRAVLMAKGAELTVDLLPARIRQAGGSEPVAVAEPSPIHLGMSLAEVEKEFIRMTIASVGGNKLKAAEIMGVSRRALYNKLKRHGLM